MSLALAAHLFGVVIWVGGMFFAYVALRPAAAKTLQPPERLSLWRATFQIFFTWVWLAIALLLASGFYMIWRIGGFDAVPLNVWLMMIVGLAMTVIFIYVYFVLYARLTEAVAAQNWPAGAQALAKIRILVGVNLILGLITVLLGVQS